MPTDREYFEEIRDVTFTKAKVDGLDIVIPLPTQLQLDLDVPWTNKSDYVDGFVPVLNIMVPGGKASRANKVLDRLLERMAIVKWEAWKSNGGNCHVMLTLASELDPTSRVALHAILGSDPMREMLNLSRIMCGAEDPIALFRPQQKDAT